MNVQQMQALIFMANVAVVSSLACGIGLLFARCCGSCAISLRHAVLLWSLLIAILCPGMLGLATVRGIGWLRMVVPDSKYNSSADSVNSALDQIAENSNGDEQFERTTYTGTLGRSFFDWDFAQIVGGLWGFGAIFMGTSLGRGCLKVRRFRRSLEVCRNSRVRRMAADICGTMNVRSVMVCESRLTNLPLCLGLFRPAVVLPQGFTSRFDEEQIRLVLLHEIAHLARHDHCVAGVQAIGGTLFWWNPLLHVLNRRLNALREQICDDYVVRHTRQGRRLADLLVRIAECDAAARPELPFASALFDRDLEELEQRVRRLLDGRLRRERRFSRGVVGTMIGVGLLLSMSLVVPLLRADEWTNSAPEKIGAISDRDNSTISGTAKANKPESDKVADLSGNWLLHLPAGFDHRVQLERIDQNHYRLSPKRLNMSGVYELQAKRLVMQIPNDSRLTEFQWELREAADLVLIGQPARSKTGASYLGATMNKE